MKTAYLAGKGFNAYVNRLFELDDALWIEVRDSIADFRPSVVGITAKTQNFASACNVVDSQSRSIPRPL
jgi:hypothetical protein